MRNRIGAMFFPLLLRSHIASARRARRTSEGMEFLRFARELGWRLLAAGRIAGVNYLLTPVSSVRYFELPFALRGLPANPGRWLDVSSPRIFSLYTARRFPGARIDVINPDPEDARETEFIARMLRLDNLTVVSGDVSVLRERTGQFDAVWAISVVEHIRGTMSDTESVSLMHKALRVGGRMILTVPVDRKAWDEYRDRDAYGLQARTEQGYFFQRYYDEADIEARLLSVPGLHLEKTSWFGETESGWFADYERRWMRDGHRVTVDDPMLFLEHFQTYDAWAQMPGKGVCAMVIDKGRE